MLILAQCTVHMYSQTCLFRTSWGPKNCPDYRGALISQVSHIYIAMGPQLTVLIIKVSLF